MVIGISPLTYLLHTIYSSALCEPNGIHILRVQIYNWETHLITKSLLLLLAHLHCGSPFAYSSPALGLNSLHISMPLAFMAYRWKSITVALHKNKTWWGVSVVASTRSGCDSGEKGGDQPKTDKVYSEQIFYKWQTFRAVICEFCASLTQQVFNSVAESDSMSVWGNF